MSFILKTMLIRSPCAQNELQSFEWNEMCIMRSYTKWVFIVLHCCQKQANVIIVKFEASRFKMFHKIKSTVLRDSSFKCHFDWKININLTNFAPHILFVGVLVCSTVLKLFSVPFETSSSTFFLVLFSCLYPRWNKTQSEAMVEKFY